MQNSVPLAVALVALSAVPSTAQQGMTALPVFCGPEAIIGKMAADYKEQRVGAGLAPGGKVLFEVTVSASGSFSIIMHNANGTSCLVGSGENWLEYAAPIMGRAS